MATMKKHVTAPIYIHTLKAHPHIEYYLKTRCEPKRAWNYQTGMLALSVGTILSLQYFQLTFMCACVSYVCIGIGSYPTRPINVYTKCNKRYSNAPRSTYSTIYYTLHEKEIGSLDNTEIKGFCFNFL